VSWWISGSVGWWVGAEHGFEPWWEQLSGKGTREVRSCVTHIRLFSCRPPVGGFNEDTLSCPWFAVGRNKKTWLKERGRPALCYSRCQPGIYCMFKKRPKTKCNSVQKNSEKY